MNWYKESSGNLQYLERLVNFIIRIYRHADTICSCVEPFLTTYSIDMTDYCNYEIHSDVKKYEKDKVVRFTNVSCFRIGSL